MQQPFHCEIEHRLGLNCFTSGPVSCRVRLDRGGYVPGETIGIWASVHNQSRVTIKRTKASLTEVRRRQRNGKLGQAKHFRIEAGIINLFIRVVSPPSVIKTDQYGRTRAPAGGYAFGTLMSLISCGLRVLQTIQYMAKNRVVQTETRELASLNRGKIRAGETDDWRNEQLYVPPLPPTNLRGCHIIRIQYDVFVRP